MVFGVIFVAMSPLLPVSHEMTTLWLLSVCLLDFKVLKMHRSSRPCHSTYAVMWHSQEASRFPFRQCGCIKTKVSVIAEVPSLGVLNFAALQGFWYKCTETRVGGRESLLWGIFLCPVCDVCRCIEVCLPQEAWWFQEHSYAWGESELCLVCLVCGGGRRASGRSNLFQILK